MTKYEPRYNFDLETETTRLILDWKLEEAQERVYQEGYEDGYADGYRDAEAEEEPEP